MGVAAMDQNQLDQIGNYVKSHIRQWMKEADIDPSSRQPERLDREIIERIITVEQQLKFQNEKLEMMLHQSDKRFEDMNLRFSELREDLDKRFNRLYGFLTALFITMLGGFIPLLIKAL